MLSQKVQDEIHRKIGEEIMSKDYDPMLYGQALAESSITGGDVIKMYVRKRKAQLESQAQKRVKQNGRAARIFIDQMRDRRDTKQSLSKDADFPF